MTGFIVNPAGYVHEVEDDALDAVLAQDGYRTAEKAEIANYYAVQGLKPPTAGKAAPKGKADKADEG